MDDWSLWSKHVLNELQRQATNLDQLEKTLNDNNSTLLRNTISLEDHIRRTNALEEKILNVYREVEILRDKSKEIEWISGHSVKLVLALSGLATLISTVAVAVRAFMKP